MGIPEPDDEEQVSVAGLLATAAAAVELERGSIRITARFERALLIEPVELATFRVPGHAIHSVIRGPISVTLLEQVARRLKLERYNRSEIVAEYEVVDGVQQFRWLDIITRQP